MSKRHFSILLVVAILVAAAVLLIPSPTGKDDAGGNSLFLPELASAVNDISLVRISGAEDADTVTLERKDSGWVVQESHNYTADWTVLRPLLAALSQAVVVEEKTSNPEYYFRLGVQDPDAEDSGSKLIEFPGNESLPAVIVGNSAQNRDGQYLRIKGQAPSVLVDRAITLPLNNSGWMDREILDIPDERVVAVVIRHSDGESVAIERESAEVTDFSLVDIPEGRETGSSWTINQIAGVFSELQLESVARVDEINWDSASELQLTTGDGLQINAWLAEDEEDRWIRLEASGGEEADAINAKVGGWAYNISLYQFDAMNKRMEDLLTPIDDDSDDSGA